MRVDTKVLFGINGSESPGLAHAGRLSAAAKEFESVLLGEWLKGAESSFSTVPGMEDDHEDCSQMNDFAMHHLAQELTERGGIGIAKLVEGALLKSSE